MACSSSSSACRLLSASTSQLAGRSACASRRSLHVAACPSFASSSRRTRTLPSNHTTRVSDSRRAVHTLPPLSTQLDHPEIGCLPFLQPGSVNLIGRTWQEGLLTRLNDEVKGTDFENASLVETVMGASQDRNLVLAFNYASLALNNAFFLHNLVPKRDLSAAPPQPAYQNTPNTRNHCLASSIDRDFQSLPAFRSAFSAAAMSMSGSGWVWLVHDSDFNLGIVPTFGAGTVLVQNRQQHGGQAVVGSIQVDGAQAHCNALNAEAVADFEANAAAAAPGNTRTSSSPSAATLGSRRFSTTASARAILDREPSGSRLYPLLCLSVHEHAWLADYGIWGKEQYIRNFWECVNWEKLQKDYSLHRG